MNRIWKRRMTTTIGYLCHRTDKGKQVLRGQEEQADKISLKNRIKYKTITLDHSLGLNVIYLSQYSQTEHLTITSEHYSYLVWVLIPVFLTFKPHSQNTHITVTSNHYSYPLFLHHVNYASTTVRSGLFPPDWDGLVSKNRTGPPCGPVPIFFEDYTLSGLEYKDRTVWQSRLDRTMGSYFGPVPKFGTGLLTNQFGPVRSV